MPEFPLLSPPSSENNDGEPFSILAQRIDSLRITYPYYAVPYDGLAQRAFSGIAARDRG